jgi:hypothetical protein
MKNALAYWVFVRNTVVKKFYNTGQIIAQILNIINMNQLWKYQLNVYPLTPVYIGVVHNNDNGKKSE